MVSVKFAYYHSFPRGGKGGEARPGPTPSANVCISEFIFVYCLGVDLFDSMVYANRREQRTTKWFVALMMQMFNWCLINSFVQYRWSITEKERATFSSAHFRYMVFKDLLHSANVTLTLPFPVKVGYHLPIWVGCGWYPVLFSDREQQSEAFQVQVNRLCRSGLHAATQHKPRTRQLCMGCDLFLCKDCFATYHMNRMSASNSQDAVHLKDALVAKYSK